MEPSIGSFKEDISLCSDALALHKFWGVELPTARVGSEIFAFEPIIPRICMAQEIDLQKASQIFVANFPEPEGCDPEPKVKNPEPWSFGPEHL